MTSYKGRRTEEKYRKKRTIVLRDVQTATLNLRNQPLLALSLQEPGIYVIETDGKGKLTIHKVDGPVEIETTT